MAQQIGAARMRHIGKRLGKELEGLGFALFIFEFHKPGVSNYISNVRRDGMITAMKETLARFESKQDFDTPEEN